MQEDNAAGHVDGGPTNHHSVQLLRCWVRPEYSDYDEDDDDDDEEEEEDGNNLLDPSHRLLHPVTALHIGWFSFFRYCHNSSSQETVKMANNMHVILGSVSPTDNSGQSSK